MVKFYHENGMFAENCSKLVEKESFFQHTETMILKLKGREKEVILNPYPPIAPETMILKLKGREKGREIYPLRFRQKETMILKLKGREKVWISSIPDTS